MKIFISWSGELSQSVAMILRTWLKSVIQVVEPYVSSEDVEKGTRWFAEIGKHLEEVQVGIVCLTRENMGKPWILFEAGAISRSIDRSRVTPLLIDLSPADLTGPLAQFQATTISESEMLRLVKSIGTLLGDERFSPGLIESAFKKWWPDFRKDVELAIRSAGAKKNQPEIRSDRAILEELLETTRSMAQHASRPSGETMSTPLFGRDADFLRILSGLEKRRRRMLIAALEGASTAYLEGKDLRIEFDPGNKHSHDILAKPDNLSVLQEVAQEALGSDIDVHLSITRKLF